MENVYPDHAIDVTDSGFRREVLGFPGAVVVFFWAPTCGYCQRLMPVFDQLAAEYAGKIKFTKLITGQNPMTSSRYHVDGVPTLLYLKAGRQVDRTVGALPRAEIQRRLDMLL